MNSNEWDRGGSAKNISENFHTNLGQARQQIPKKKKKHEIQLGEMLIIHFGVCTKTT